jgi:hypothetical protein
VAGPGGDMAAALSSGALLSTLARSRPLLPALVQARRCYSRTRRLRRSTHRPHTPHRPHRPLSLLHPLTAPPPPLSPPPSPSSPGGSASTSPRQVPLPLDTRRASTRLPSSSSALLPPRPPRLSPTSLACACACARDSPTLPLSLSGAYEDLASSLLGLPFSLSLSLSLFHRTLHPPTTQHARDHLAHLLAHALVRLRLWC